MKYVYSGKGGVIQIFAGLLQNRNVLLRKFIFPFQPHVLLYLKSAMSIPRALLGVFIQLFPIALYNSSFIL